MIRYVLDIIYPVRAKRGEMRGPNGRLLKCISGFANNLLEAQAEAQAFTATLDYGTPVEIRYYDAADWRADCMNVQPLARVSLT
jgi:hypothetical protein